MNRFARLILPLSGALLLAACSASPAERMEQARQDFARQDYAAARAELGAALKEEPGNRAMLLLLAQTHLRLGDGAAAQGVIDRLKAQGAPDLGVMEAEAHLLRGQAASALELLGSDATSDGWRVRAAAQLMLGQEAQALAAFRQGLAQGGDARLAGDFARFLLATGDLAGAGAQLARVQRERPEAIETLMLAGAIAEKQGRTDAALRLYQAAAEKFPWLAAPLVAQANALDLLGRLDEAAKLTEAAAKVQPGDPAVLDLQLSVYSQQGQWDKIRKILQSQEQTLSPTSAAGLTYAEALLRLDHPEQARALFSKAVIVEPGNRYARMMLGEAQLATGDARAALATLRPLAEGVFANPRELELAAKAATAAGDPLGAQLTARLQSAEFKRQGQLVGQGLAATAQGNWRAALQAWQGLQAYGEDAELLRRIAYSASMTGQHALAVSSADKALALRLGDGELLNLAGVVRLAQGGDLAAAVALLEAAFKADPDNAQFRADLAKAKAAAG